MNPPAPPPSFQREVLPILRTACIGCHSAPTPAGGISLGSYAELMKGGKNGAAVVPGKSKSSRLVLMLTGEEKPIMPPGPGLKAADIDIVRRWVDAGAKNDAAVPVAPTGKTPASPTVKKAVTPPRPRAIGKLRDITSPVHALAFSPDGKLLAIGTYQRVLLCDPATRQVVATWGGHADTVRSVAFSPDGKWLVAGGGISGAFGEARVWSVAEKRQVRVLGGHEDNVNAVTFSPDGKLLVTGGSDKMIQVWDAVTGKLLQTLRDHANAVLALAFRPDGKYLASSGADKSVKVWDTAAWKRLYSIGGGEESVTAVVFAQGGSPLVTTSADRMMKVWNFGPEGSGLARNVGGHGNSVWGVSLTPDGQFAATASGDKTVKLWKIADGSNPATLTDPKDWVYAVRFSPDGKQLVGGTWDGQVYFWNVETRKLEGALSTLPVKK